MFTPILIALVLVVFAFLAVKSAKTPARRASAGLLSLALVVVAFSALATNRTGYMVSPKIITGQFPNDRPTCPSVLAPRGSEFVEYKASGFDLRQACSGSSGTVAWRALPTPTGTVVP